MYFKNDKYFKKDRYLIFIVCFILHKIFTVTILVDNYLYLNIWNKKYNVIVFYYIYHNCTYFKNDKYFKEDRYLIFFTLFIVHKIFTVTI